MRWPLRENSQDFVSTEKPSDRETARLHHKTAFSLLLCISKPTHVLFFNTSTTLWQLLQSQEKAAISQLARCFPYTYESTLQARNTSKDLHCSGPPVKASHTGIFCNRLSWEKPCTSKRGKCGIHQLSANYKWQLINWYMCIVSLSYNVKFFLLSFHLWNMSHSEILPAFTQPFKANQVVLSSCTMFLIKSCNTREHNGVATRWKLKT